MIKQRNLSDPYKKPTSSKTRAKLAEKERLLTEQEKDDRWRNALLDVAEKLIARKDRVEEPIIDQERFKYPKSYPIAAAKPPVKHRAPKKELRGDTVITVMKSKGKN
jgi:hypothetical protein